jgi:hypothetical protein
MSLLTFDVIEKLDPGIRADAIAIAVAGFNTTDSGDGVSKPDDWYESGEAIRIPHVFCATTPGRLIDEATRLQQFLGTAWRVEATYWPTSETAMLLAFKELIPASETEPTDAGTRGSTK